MIAAIVIPAFDLRAALRLRPRLQAQPAALAPLPGTEPLVGSVTGAAEAQGVRPGMRLGEALATCPELELVEQDPATAEQAWEEILRRLEDAGSAHLDGSPFQSVSRDGEVTKQGDLPFLELQVSPQVPASSEKHLAGLFGMRPS